jgi:ligand-binding SRPBCC domain-containing protein
MAILAALVRADPTRPARVEHLHLETIVAAPLDATFAFFADAANLQRLTPPWLSFRIRTPLPIVMRVGTEIDYRIRLHGLPIPWRSRIDVWQPGVRFVDRQILGPYRWWVHEHRFEPIARGVRVVDVVEYAPRFEWMASPFVRRDLSRIFAFRREALRKVFESA